MAMTKKTAAGESFVTQSQWVEGMEMIKGFFGKMFKELQEQKKEIKGVKKQVSLVEKQVGGLRYEFDEFRKEQRETNERLEKKIEVNTEAVSSLTGDVRKVENLEFEVYNHEGRITKLEKAR